MLVEAEQRAALDVVAHRQVRIELDDPVRRAERLLVVLVLQLDERQHHQRRQRLLVLLKHVGELRLGRLGFALQQLRHGKLGLQPLYLRRLLDRLLQVLHRLLHVAGTGEGGAVQRIGAPVRGFVVDDGLQRRDRTLRVVRPKLRGGVELAGERAPRHRPDDLGEEAVRR